MQSGSFIIICIIILVWYFLPALVSLLRNHNNKLAIFALNLLLGWSLIGWIIALVWSLTSNVTKKPNRKERIYQEKMRKYEIELKAWQDARLLEAVQKSIEK